MAITQLKTQSLILSSALLLQCGLPCFAEDMQTESASPSAVPALIQPDVVMSANDPQTEEEKTEAAIRHADEVANANLPTIAPYSAPNPASDVLPNPATHALPNLPTDAQPNSAPDVAQISSESGLDRVHQLAQSPDAVLGDTVLRGGVSSDPVVAGKQVDDLTRQILLKLIELERFNLHYTLETAKQGRWKGWRYAFFQEINAGTGLAGSIISTCERGSHLHSPGSVSRVVQERANIVPMIGSIIGASAAAMEFGINEYHDIVARSKGFAPKAARLHVTALKSEINRLLAQREALLKVEQTSAALAARCEIDAAEGKVLTDLRDESLMEFERFQIGARKIFAFQQSQYFFDCTKYTLNAIGSYFAYKSLHDRDRRWNGRAGVMWNISGGVYMFGPIISRLIAKGVGEGHKRALRGVTRDAHETTIAKLDADRILLDNLCRSTSIAPDKVETAVARAGMYESTEKKYTAQIESGKKSAAKARTTATQNIGSGLYVGASRVASGVLFTIPGFNRAFNGKTDRANKVTNQDLFAAAVIGIPAGAFSMLDTLRIQVQGEVTRHRLKKSGLLPSQIANARLKQLDDMETRLAVTK